MDVSFLERALPGIRGVLNADARLKGQGIDIHTLTASAAIDAHLKEVVIPGVRMPLALQLRADGRLDHGTIHLSQVAARAAETRLLAKGAFDLQSGHMHGQLEASSKDLESVLLLAGLEGQTEDFRGRFALSGPWRRPEIEIDASVKQVRLKNLKLGDVDITAKLNRQGRLHVQSLNIVNQGTLATAQGSLQLLTEAFHLHESMPLAASCRFQDTEIQDFWAAANIDGTFQGQLHLGGTLRSLNATAELDAENLAYREWSLGSLSAALRWMDGRLHVDRCRIDRSGAFVDAMGDIHLFEPNSWKRRSQPILNLAVNGQAPALADFFPNFHGSAHLTGQLKGPFSELTGQGRLEMADLTAYGQHMDRADLHLELQNNRLRILQLQAASGTGSSMTGSGWIDVERHFSFDIQARNLPLAGIADLQEKAPILGSADVHIWGEGTLDDPFVEGTLHLKSIRVNHQEMTDMDFRIELAHDQLTLSGHQTFQINAVYNLLTQAFEIYCLFDDTDITPFFLAAGQSGFGGRLSGKVSVVGNRKAFLKSDGFMELTTLLLTYQGEPLVRSQGVYGRLENSVISIPEVELTFLESGHLRMSGSGNIEGLYQLRVEGQIPAASASFFLKEATDIHGSVAIRAELKKTGESPELSGQIELRDVGYAIPHMDRSLSDITGSIRLTSAHIMLEKITGKLNSGRFEARGKMALDTFRPGMIQLSLKGEKLPIQVPETLDVLVDTALFAEGTLDNLTVTGEIVLLEGLYYKDVKINLIETVRGKKQSDVSLESDRGSSFLDRIQYRIQVKYREPFIVDNNIAYLEIHPDLVIGGTRRSPDITGMAKVQEGILRYHKKSFVVERGIVSFEDPYRIEPEIDIQGSVQIRRWRISVTVSGSPDQLTFELASTPYEEDSDILSLLIFGKTSYEMAGGDAADPFDSTEVLLAQLMASRYGDEFKKATGLDYVEVGNGADASENDPDAVSVTVGKDLTERMTVKYTVESGSEEYIQRVSEEYKLIEYVLLSGFQNTKGNYGGEIIFRIEFRMLP